MDVKKRENAKKFVDYVMGCCMYVLNNMTYQTDTLYELPSSLNDECYYLKDDAGNDKLLVCASVSDDRTVTLTFCHFARNKKNGYCIDESDLNYIKEEFNKKGINIEAYTICEDINDSLKCNELIVRMKKEKKLAPRIASFRNYDGNLGYYNRVNSVSRIKRRRRERKGIICC